MTPPAEFDFAAARARMVDTQLAARDIRDRRVLAAMRTVPRHRFVPPDEWPRAYADRPLPIGADQTISQPYMVAYMSQALALRGIERVLEIGTGCGYQTAVLAELAGEVFSIEIVPSLFERARDTLAALAYSNIRLRVADGRNGWPEAAPFDAILAAAAPRGIPDALIEQLVPGGRLVIPVGGVDEQELVLVERGTTGWTERRLMPVRFVPMTGGEVRP